MKTSSFLWGVALGCVASRMMSRRGISLTSMMKTMNLGSFANTAMDKVQGMNSNSSRSSKMSSSSGLSSNQTAGLSSNQTAGHSHESQKSNHSKTSDLSQIKEFIRKNPDVKHEVEQILKETGTAVPGL